MKIPINVIINTIPIFICSPQPCRSSYASVVLYKGREFDRSAVEIQYAAVYTESILPSIQCTWSIYCQFSTAHTLQHSSSIPAVYSCTADLVECTFSVYCNYTSLYCISTALRSGSAWPTRTRKIFACSWHGIPDWGHPGCCGFLLCFPSCMDIELV